MRPYISADFKLLLTMGIAVVFASKCLGQTVALPATDSAASWKTSQLAELDRQIGVETVAADREELLARKVWLENWTPGSLPTKPTGSSQLPKLRTESILNSDSSTEIRKKLNWDNTDQDKSDLLILERALADYPDDIGLHQLYLHWMDHPIRRKSYLKQIESSARSLIKSLEGRRPLNTANQLALEFTMYRRGRALAYRELPDVVKQTPIEDPQRLDQEIVSAYQDLIASAGKGRSEFILLEIRMLRRDKSFGKALAMVEKYGAVIQPKWYLKKRRDLLGELQWEFPFAEAARIYADEFPNEVAKEAELNR